MPASFNVSRLFVNILCISLILCLTHLLVRNASMLTMETETQMETLDILVMHLKHLPLMQYISPQWDSRFGTANDNHIGTTTFSRSRDSSLGHYDSDGTVTKY